METNTNYFDLLGVEEPKEQTGANEAPETAEETAGREAEEREETAEGQEGAEPKKQSKQENRRYAAARRSAEAERDAAIARAERAEAQLKDIFQKAELENPYTGEKITNAEEFAAWAETRTKKQAEKFRRQTGMTEEEYEKMIEELPEVQAARAQAEAARRAEGMRQIQVQIEQIGKIDPSVTSLDDLTEREDYPVIFDYCTKKGLSLLEAFQLANLNAAQNASRRAAEQAARNAQGKAHLGTPRGRGEVQEPVPDDVIRQYRRFLPDATDAEIREHWRKNHK